MPSTVKENSITEKYLRKLKSPSETKNFKEIERSMLASQIQELNKEISELQADIIVHQENIPKIRKEADTKKSNKEKRRLLEEVELFQRIIIRNRASLDQKEAELKDLKIKLSKS